MAKVQIDRELFDELCCIFGLSSDDLTDDEVTDLYASVRDQLRDKMEAIERREVYSRYKGANNAQEREANRQAYLDAAGIKESYRWSQAYEMQRQAEE